MGYPNPSATFRSPAIHWNFFLGVADDATCSRKLLLLVFPTTLSSPPALRRTRIPSSFSCERETAL